MALSGKLSVEVDVKAPAAKYFELFTTQLHLLQKLCERVHETKLFQGDDWHDIGSGSVKHWTYIIDGKVTTCKEHIVSIDKESKTAIYNLFDGSIGQNYKTFNLIIQPKDQVGGGSTVKWTVEYEKINENVEAPYGYMEYFDKMTVDMDAHLIKA